MVRLKALGPVLAVPHRQVGEDGNGGNSPKRDDGAARLRGVVGVVRGGCGPNEVTELPPASHFHSTTDLP